MGDPIYHLDLRVERCRARIRVNDLPFGELIAAGEQPEWFAPPMNPYLVGSGNLVQVEVEPAFDDEGTATEIAEAVVELAVVRVERGGVVAPGEGDRVTTYAVGPELAQNIRDAEEADEELEIPQTFFFLFDNEGARFDGTIRDDLPYGNQAALRTYAIRLRDLVRAGDVVGLVAEMEPKVLAYAEAYSDDAGRIRDSLAETLRDRIFPAGPTTEFEAPDVRLVSLAGGRIWELRKPDGRPLISTEPDEHGGTYQIPILVAETDGTLRVVR
ncbi:MAG: hypothetical protein AB8I08_28275 [Sandaracinaceae bacterium]